jgi:hypothetical protein
MKWREFKDGALATDRKRNLSSRCEQIASFSNSLAAAGKH